jgi:LPXTG-motif cell wall-anchored protein
MLVRNLRRHLSGRAVSIMILTALVLGLAPLAAGATGGGSNEVGYWSEAGVKFDHVDAPTFTVPEPPEGYRWALLVLKAGSTGCSVDEENFQIPDPVVGRAYSWEGTSYGVPVTKDISHAILCKEPIPPEVTLQFTKIWIGDDRGDATVEFFVNDRGPIAEGQVVVVTHLQGQTIPLEEKVTGLPESCTFESDLPGTLAIPEVEEDTLITVTVTNEVTCVPEKETTTTTTSTTVPTEVLPIVVTSSTTTVPTEVLPIVVTTTVGIEVSPVVAETLPFTGSNDLGWLVLAGVALTLGTILVVGSRREDTEA